MGKVKEMLIDREEAARRYLLEKWDEYWQEVQEHEDLDTVARTHSEKRFQDFVTYYNEVHKPLPQPQPQCPPAQPILPQEEWRPEDHTASYEGEIVSVVPMPGGTWSYRIVYQGMTFFVKGPDPKTF